MARDPNNPRETENERRRRQRQLIRDVPFGAAILGAVGSEQPAGETLTDREAADYQSAKDFRNASLRAGEAFRNEGLPGYAREVRSAAEGVVAPAMSALDRRVAQAAGMNQSPQTGNFSDVRSTTDNDRNALTRRNGLTRVVQTAPGVYTDDPNATGDVRYYDATGGRADVGTPQGITRNTSVEDYNAAERRAKLDLTNPANVARVAETGRRSLVRQQDMLDEGRTRANDAFMRSLSPEDRAGLLEAQLREQGENARANAGLANQRLIAQGAQAVQRQGVQLNAAKEAAALDRYERERAGNPETEALATQEFFGSLNQLPENQRVETLLSTPQGRRIIANFTNNLREGSNPLSDDIDPAVLEPGVFSTFRDSRSPLLGSGYSGDELMGLQPEDVRTIINAARQSRLRR